MRNFKFFALTAIAGLCFVASTPKTQAQVTVGIGVAPACPYGYYDYAPYSCAPYGYYGPEWFSGGVFIGAGPWFHGPEHFYGHVDNHYDVNHGYKGLCRIAATMQSMRSRPMSLRATRCVMGMVTLPAKRNTNKQSK